MASQVGTLLPKRPPAYLVGDEEWSSVVTPLTAEAAGFLFRWLGHVAEGQPGPVDDVHRADVVRVGGEAARGALEVGLGKAVLLCDVPAFGARTGGVAGLLYSWLTVNSADP
jgi:hypothetical protein